MDFSYFWRVHETRLYMRARLEVLYALAEEVHTTQFVPLHAAVDKRTGVLGAHCLIPRMIGEMN